jgi:1-acyl-sn-glycerol-3-phosphate acyltransferase
MSLYRRIKASSTIAGLTLWYGFASVLGGPWTKERKACLWAMRNWSVDLLNSLQVKVELTGVEKIPEGPVVYCMNHQSTLDLFVTGGYLPGDFKWAAKQELMYLPVVGWHLWLAGHIPVPRGKGGATAELIISRMVDVLHKGKPVMVFPEGTRTKDGRLRPFKRGAFAAAVRANVPVVPIALEGAFQIMGKGSLAPANDDIRTLQVQVGEALYPSQEGDEESRVNELRDRCFQSIAAMYEAMGGIV